MKYLFVVLLLFGQRSFAAADYYSDLGVSRNATQQDIRKAYRRLAMKFHPDRISEQEIARDPDLLKRSEARFKAFKEAYEALSDPHRRQNYDRDYASGPSVSTSNSNLSVDDLQRELDILKTQTTEVGVQESLSRLNAFGQVVSGSDQAFFLFYKQIEALIGKDMFRHLANAQYLIQMTASWSYQSFLSYGVGVNFDSLHNETFQKLIYGGHSLADVLEMLGHTEVVADMRALQGSRLDTFLRGFGTETDMKNAGSMSPTLKHAFKINEGSPRFFLVPLLVTGQIRTKEQFESAVAAMKNVGKSLDLTHKLHASLQGNIHYVFPFISELDFASLLDLTVMVGIEPTEGLALLEEILKAQRLHKNLTGDQISALIESLMHGMAEPGYEKVDRYNGPGVPSRRSKALRNGNQFPELQKYLAARPGYDGKSLEQLTLQHKRPIGQRQLDQNNFLFPFLAQDVIAILAASRDVLESSQISDFDFSRIQYSLGISNSWEFKAKLFAARFGRTAKPQWGAQLPEPQYKAVRRLIDERIPSAATATALSFGGSRSQCESLFLHGAAHEIEELNSSAMKTRIASTLFVI